MTAGVRIEGAREGDELSLDVLARVAEKHTQRDIRITCSSKPIPWRGADFTAIEPSKYEPGAPMGMGPTAEAALCDLLDQLEEEEHA